MFTATVTVTDDDGGSDSDTAGVTIAGVDPEANATIPSSGFEGSAIAFTGDFTDDGTGHTFFWDFGDGNTSTAQNPSHTYRQDGVYSVSFTVTDPDGLFDISTGDVDVANVAPTIVSAPVTGTS